LTSTLPICPDLWSGSSAQDGLLLRMRIPGGILTGAQSEAIAHFSLHQGGGYVQVTNRANLQIRELKAAIAPEQFRQFQDLGLASGTVSVDALRNIMASPTAGIDAQMLVDTRPLVRAWDAYLQAHAELAALSPKFSLGLDGGEAVSVRDRHNDLVLAAEAGSGSDAADPASAMFRLYLAVEADGLSDTGILVSPQRSMALLAALAQVYLDYSQGRQRPDGRRPRLRHAIAEWGMAGYLERVQQCLPFGLTRGALACVGRSPVAAEAHQSEAKGEAIAQISAHLASYLGIHPQRQPGLSYIGIALPLGRIEASQLLALADLAQAAGSGTLRLTPWQTLILADIATVDLAEVQTQLAALGFHWSAVRPDSALVACSGRRGCAAAATDTQAQALELVTHLEQCLNLTQPLNIHISGCGKSCAQHSPLDMALVGRSIAAADEMAEAYDLYVGAAAKPFGRQVFQAVEAAAVPRLLEQMIRAYQRQQRSPESFGSFCDRHSIWQLQQWFQPPAAANPAQRVAS